MSVLFETPVLFLIFNRPDTTQLVFNQIKQIRPKYLYVAADGPRETIAGESEKCCEARAIINQIDWDCEIKTLYRDKNLGCGLAVSSALTWFFDQVPEGIILEDDCFPDLSFFRYCQELLIKYRQVDQVKLIGGNNYQKGIVRGKGSYYFSYYPEIWGWASWRRAWANFDFEMNDLEETFRTGGLDHVFQSRGERNYWYWKLLNTKRTEKVNVWDYQFMFSIWKDKGVVISPGVNLVKNIGLDNNPTHHSLYDSRKDLKLHSLAFPLIHPDLEVDKKADQYTFAHEFSWSAQRLFRLLKENGIKIFLSYLVNKMLR
ncbi:nucleotide-diphospho-sugar transferase [Adhaeribacter swui]|uniref:Nucleotide-diphospho-sugar transferase n=1 Tax=Adhaeribacter swui TaxID=2086471 RepID=A0A7G7G586_9BACT|nr:nucleotide-diphospho-sugar transferase [Adhaeribacter swui]QNF32320.1 nucleotide-diphospho-sugar transferase [Adhaeribacter swui]